jgi:two-component system, NtrC family, nitrogen regulation sensor histidine kinase NtrY
VSNDRQPARNRSRRWTIVALVIGIFLLFSIVFSQAAFNLNPLIRPNTNEQTFVLVALSALIFLLLLALTFVLIRTVLKLYAERRVGVLGARFRTRMVVGALFLSCCPVIFLFLFAYGLMNRSIDKWFSRPVEEVREQTAAVANLLSSYAAEDARSEALEIATAPETLRSYDIDTYSPLDAELQRHKIALKGGFALAIRDGEAKSSFDLPEPWEVLQHRIPPENVLASARPHPVRIGDTDYMLATAEVPPDGQIVVGLPLPKDFATTLNGIEESERRYYELAQQRKAVRITYMGLLWLLTVLVLFAATWFALFLSKFVTRPVAALAAATEELSRGRFDYRVDVAISPGDELGRLVQSFNRMAAELENSRAQIEASSRSLADANTAIEQRRRHMETILESIPTGVLSLDALHRVSHTNTALRRLFSHNPDDSSRDINGPRDSTGSPDASDNSRGHDANGNGDPTPERRFAIGSPLPACFPPDFLDELHQLLRRSNRMGSTSAQLQFSGPNGTLNLNVTAASLQENYQRWGYVLVFEDLSDLLRAQKQAAWREVARRVAHEIKNPLTPIALSAERIRRHLAKGVTPDPNSLAIISTCADTIAGAAETVRRLVDEFSALARFPASQPRPADLNTIVESALAQFHGRLDGVTLHTRLASDLPRVMADPEAIKRVIANLVDNAAEAMQDSLLREAHIQTALLSEKDAVEIVVSDTGHGVTREMKERLFMPYFSTKDRGTGLGLAIVSRIIEDHRGSIRVEENRPVGARFIVELPLAPEQSEPDRLEREQQTVPEQAEKTS